MPTCANMCHYAPRWANIAVCSCAEKDSLFVPMAQAPAKAGAKDLLYSLNLTHEVRSLFLPKVILQVCSAFVDMSVCQWLRKRPRFAQGQPKSYFQRKELDRSIEAIVPMNIE